MRLSVNLMPEAPVGELVDLARFAEQQGFSRCWVYDEGVVTRDVYVTLTAIAAATSTIKLGPGITNPYVRHPGATAVAIATLHEFSGGRAFVGIGAGGGLTLGPLAIDRTKPLTSVAAMIEALRGMFAGDAVTIDAPTFSLQNAQLDYAPGDVEILVAGRGPKMMELGGREADGFYLGYIHKELLGSAIDALHANRPADAAPLSIIYSTMVATTDAELEQARAALTYRLVDSPADVKDLIGMTPDDTAAVRAALADGGPVGAAHLIKPEWVPNFVITGTIAEAASELAALSERFGIDEFQVPVLHPETGAELIERSSGLLR